MVTAAPTPDPMDLIRRRAAENGDGGYGDFVSARPYSYYRRRVDELGFAALGRVLDVGCGLGQWTAALAEVNDDVVGLDQSEQRLEIAAELATSLSLHNVAFELGDAGRLPYPDGSFRGLFCHGVFMFLDRGPALAEFDRVLEPGGRLYVCTNATGWWLRLWFEALRSGNANVRRSAFQGWALGWRGSPPNAVGTRRARRLLRGGWTGVDATLEGLIGVDPLQAEPLYSGRWHGVESVIEFAAVKAGEPEAGHEPSSVRESRRALDIGRRTLERETYEYLSPLELHPQPRPVVDLVNNCDAALVRRATARAQRADRLEVLRALYAAAIAGAQTEEERILACVTFAQKHFFHHFAGQPMQHGMPVQDPVASLLLGNARCGTSARFLVDLFVCNGMPAALAGGACHTWPEVGSGGRWIVADSSLYPPGVLPRADDGSLLSFADATARPDLLNRVPSYLNYHHEYIAAFLAAYPETRSELEPLLRRPLLPSSGYFGSEFFSSSGRSTGVIQRYRKVGTPEEWQKDPHFGWGSLETEDVPVPVLAVEQRPPQVTDVRVDGPWLVWTPVDAPAGERIRYRVVSSPTSRGWEYDALPVGCTFQLRGHVFYSDAPRVRLGDLGRDGFVSVVAENAAWAEREIFYLPSREFRLTI